MFSSWVVSQCKSRYIFCLFYLFLFLFIYFVVIWREKKPHEFSYLNECFFLAEDMFEFGWVLFISSFFFLYIQILTKLICAKIFISNENEKKRNETKVSEKMPKTCPSLFECSVKWKQTQGEREREREREKTIWNIWTSHLRSGKY